MLELRNIKKEYEGKVILEEINLKIEDGKIISLLGSSGSGKTTLLNIILGLTNPDKGEIYFNGEDISNKSMKKRGFNIVFQDYALFPNLTAYENIIYPMKNNKKLITIEEVEELIKTLDLENHLSKKIDELSGGQKQRVALARTLVMKPKILLLDEPLSALDGVIKENIKEKIKFITKKYNLTTIMVTHDPEEAMTISDKILVIDKGRVSQYGTPKEVIQSPKNKFIEEFILKQLIIKKDNIFKLFGEVYV